VKKHLPSGAAIDSAIARWRLLHAADCDSQNVPQKFILACATQQKFADFVDTDKEITSLALNTLKSAADLGIEAGGWRALDVMRKKIFINGLPSSKRSSKIKRGLGHRLSHKQDQLQELNTRLQGLLKERVKLLNAYIESIDLLRAYSNLDQSLEARLKEHESIFNIRTVFKVEDRDVDR
jgi:hypothetical protein